MDYTYRGSTFTRGKQRKKKVKNKNHTYQNYNKKRKKIWAPYFLIAGLITFRIKVSATTFIRPLHSLPLLGGATWHTVRIQLWALQTLFNLHCRFQPPLNNRKQSTQIHAPHTSYFLTHAWALKFTTNARKKNRSNGHKNYEIKYGTLRGHLPTIMNKSPNFKGVYAYSWRLQQNVLS